MNSVMRTTGHTQMTRSRKSVVRIATRHGLEEPVFELRCENELLSFPYPSRQALGSTQPTLEWILGMFFGINRPGRGVYDPLTLNGAEVRMEWSCTCTRTCNLCQHGVLRGELYFTHR
jgi:hypothetical protein